MKTGIVFDIKEFAVHDGPGIRTTVFMKGCPLRCMWCHNPEGISGKPQIMRNPGGERTVGTEYSSAELVSIIEKQADVLRMNDGGVTFSGGEPLMQATFVAEVMDGLSGLHVLLDTSGYAPRGDFELVARRCNMLYFDLKLADPDLHRKYTGADNSRILANLELAGAMDIELVVRVPLVPGVTDTTENLASIAGIVSALPRLPRVDLLPYNRSAGGKYAACGMDFQPQYDEDAPVNADAAPFRKAGLEARVC
jgi:pyruvate formate lyase activating enzyme